MVKSNRFECIFWKPLAKIYSIVCHFEHSMTLNIIFCPSLSSIVLFSLLSWCDSFFCCHCSLVSVISYSFICALCAVRSKFLLFFLSHFSICLMVLRHWTFALPYQIQNIFQWNNNSESFCIHSERYSHSNNLHNVIVFKKAKRQTILCTEYGFWCFYKMYSCIISPWEMTIMMLMSHTISKCMNSQFYEQFMCADHKTVNCFCF